MEMQITSSDKFDRLMQAVAKPGVRDPNTGLYDHEQEQITIPETQKLNRTNVDPKQVMDIAKKTRIGDDQREFTEEELQRIQDSVKHTPTNKKVLEHTEKLDKLKAELAEKQGVLAKAKRQRDAVLEGTKDFRELVGDSGATRMSVMDIDGFDIPMDREIRNGKKFAVINFDKAVPRFLKFLEQEGYQIDEDAKASKVEALVVDVLRGIRAGQVIRKHYGYDNVAGFIRYCNDLEQGVEATQAEIGDVEDALKKTSEPQLNAPRKLNISPVSEVFNRNADVKEAKIEIDSMRTEMDNIQSRIALLKDISGLSKEQAQDLSRELAGKITKLEAELADKSAELEQLVKDARRYKASIGNRVDKIKQAFEVDSKKARLKYEAQFSRKSEADRKILVDRMMKAWEKVRKDEDAVRIRKIKESVNENISNNPRVNSENIAQVDAQIAQLSEEVKQMTEDAGTLRSNLQAALIGGKLDPLARNVEVTRLEAERRRLAEELHNAQKRSARREKSKSDFLDEDVWRSRITDALENPKTMLGVLKNSPIQYMHSALNNGASRRTQERMRLLWQAMKKNSKKDPVAEKQVPKITSHLTKDQFLVSPNFRQHNNDLLTLLNAAIQHARRESTESIVELLVAGTLDVLSLGELDKKTAHKAMFDDRMKRITKWLDSPVGHEYAEEIVSIINDEGRFKVPLNKKSAIKSMAQEFINLIKHSGAIETIGGIAWPLYREYVDSWVRNKLPLEATTKPSEKTAKPSAPVKTVKMTLKKPGTVTKKKVK